MIYFVTETFLKTETPLTNNVEITDIYPLIKSVADMWVRDAIGTYFYNDLLEKYNNQTLSNDEIKVVEIMQYCIAWRACADSVLELSFQLKNKGIQTQSGDFSASAELKSITLMQKHYEQKAAFYDTRLVDFFKDNKDLFPVFLDKLNNDSRIKKLCYHNDKFNSFNSGIFSV